MQTFNSYEIIQFFKKQKLPSRTSNNNTELRADILVLERH